MPFMEIAHQPPESLPPWMPERGPRAEPADRIRSWWERARQVYPENTKKAWRNDWTVFLAFCMPQHLCPLPAIPETVAAFVEACRVAAKKPATIRRYLTTITLAHRVAKLENPCDDEAVQLEIKGLYNVMSARQRQAKAMGWEHIKRFIETAGEGIRPDRERALLTVAYDTMARRAELVALNLEDFTFLPDGTGRVLIRRSKTDQTGEGDIAYLARDTVRWLQIWLEQARITDGAVFRRLVGRGRIGGRLHVDSIAETFKRVAGFVGMPADDVDQVSGHSIRVGATQDLLALNIDLASVMQAGRWKSNRMPMRYGEHILAARGGMARAAERQGRDAADPAKEIRRVRGSTEATPSSITLSELQRIIVQCGGQDYAREYAAPLLERIQVLEARRSYRAMLEPLRSAHDQADLRGRLLEVNLAYQFEAAGITPNIAAKQGGTGDIDFQFNIGPHALFVESKLLRQDDATAAQINAQLNTAGTYSVVRDSDSDLIQKANTKKFKARPDANWVNLVAVDVSETQLGTVDTYDCVLAAAGNAAVAALCAEGVTANFLRRNEVIGVFEESALTVTAGQKEWAAAIDQLVTWEAHPRDYLHGALFLFRYPTDTAALVYDLRSVVVWNSRLIDRPVANEVEPVLYRIFPQSRPRRD
jgi:integrase